MARTKKTETLESFTEKCMQRPVAVLIQELFDTKEALVQSRNEVRGLKIRKASEEVKTELKRLRAIERKYNKINYRFRTRSEERIIIEKVISILRGNPTLGKDVFE